MVVCYKFLYKEKTQNEPDINRLSRRMSFKFPIVLRFSIWFPIMFGLVHGMVKRNLTYMRKHLYTIPIYMTLLSHQQIYQYYCIKTGQPIIWRQRGQKIIQKQNKQNQKAKKINEQMKLKAQQLAKQVNKPINAEL